MFPSCVSYTDCVPRNAIFRRCSNGIISSAAYSESVNASTSVRLPCIEEAWGNRSLNCRSTHLLELGDAPLRQRLLARSVRSMVDTARASASGYPRQQVRRACDISANSHREHSRYGVPKPRCASESPSGTFDPGTRRPARAHVHTNDLPYRPSAPRSPRATSRYPSFSLTFWLSASSHRTSVQRSVKEAVHHIDEAPRRYATPVLLESLTTHALRNTPGARPPRMPDCITASSAFTPRLKVDDSKCSIPLPGYGSAKLHRSSLSHVAGRR